MKWRFQPHNRSSMRARLAAVLSIHSAACVFAFAPIHIGHATQFGALPIRKTESRWPASVRPRFDFSRWHLSKASHSPRSQSAKSERRESTADSGSARARFVN